MGETCFEKFSPFGFNIDDNIIKMVLNLSSSKKPKTPIKKLHISYDNYNVELLFKLIVECHPGSKEVNARKNELEFSITRIDDCKKLLREQKIGLNIYFKVDEGDDLYIIYITDKPLKTEDGGLFYISINSRNDIRRMCKDVDEAAFPSAFFLHIKNPKVLKKIYEIMDKSDYMPLYDYDAYLKKVEEIIKNNGKRVY